jgi:AraC-like DNA-binding protein
MDLSLTGRSSDSPFVESIWHTRSERPGSFISAAAIHCGLVVTRYQDRTTVTIRGPETKPTLAHYPADVEFFGIVFKLGAYMPHMPANMIMDRRDLTLPEATGESFWLHGSSWELPTFENADTFIARLVREGLLVSEPIVDAVLQGHRQELSLRSIQYRFLHATGLTQGAVYQIRRARRAVALLEQGNSILDTVHEAGYFDQAHLTRSLKRFMGQTPAQIARIKQTV